MTEIGYSCFNFHRRNLWFQVDMYKNETEWVRLMVFNATFNNISVILWQSVLLVEETVVPEEYHRPIGSN